jgi:hypothetical protein
VLPNLSVEGESMPGMVPAPAEATDV